MALQIHVAKSTTRSIFKISITKWPSAAAHIVSATLSDNSNPETAFFGIILVFSLTILAALYTLYLNLRGVHTTEMESRQNLDDKEMEFEFPQVNGDGTDKYQLNKMNATGVDGLYALAKRVTNISPYGKKKDTLLKELKAFSLDCSQWNLYIKCFLTCSQKISQTDSVKKRPQARSQVCLDLLMNKPAASGDETTRKATFKSDRPKWLLWANKLHKEFPEYQEPRSSLNNSGSENEFVAFEYLSAPSPDEFWKKWTDEKSQQMTFTAISDALLAQRNASGLPGLWDKFQSSHEHRSLTHLTTIEGFEWNARKMQAVRVGIDTLGLISRCCGAVVQNQLNATITPLRLFFFQLCKYLQLSAVPAKVLIQVFGFEIHVAPGEAEAELAEMNARGIIDIVMTDDVDALIFGAEFVVRFAKPEDVKGKICDDVYIYMHTAIKNDDSLGLTRQGLVLLALIAEGDYDTGIPKAGIETGLALARCGFGDTLIEGYLRYKATSKQLQTFLTEWRLALKRELHTNSQGFLATHCHKLAKDLPDSFPELGILDAYWNPTMSWSPGHTPPNTSSWRPHLPKLPNLVQFCQQHLFPCPLLLKQLHRRVWPGMVFKMLSLPVIGYQSENAYEFHCGIYVTNITHIYHSLRLYKASKPEMKSIHLAFTTQTFLQGSNLQRPDGTQLVLASDLTEDEKPILKDATV
uniref:XPG-I domain-containing protein n=1 Tax=Moniliophthora roreri TaxID=221103 RepID=A0A0W0EVQ6_MONRR